MYEISREIIQHAKFSENNEGNSECTRSGIAHMVIPTQNEYVQQGEVQECELQSANMQEKHQYSIQSQS